MKTLLACLLLCLSVVSQTVNLSNFSGAHYEGWVRCTVDKVPLLSRGKLGQDHYVVGNSCAKDLKTIDVWCSLANGQEKHLHLSDASPSDWSLKPIPPSPLSWFGGPVTLNGNAMSFVALEVEGAAYVLQMRSRVGMFVVDLWVTWYPDQPAFCKGEVLITCSDVSRPDLSALAPPLRLSFGDALVLIPQRGLGSLIEPGTPFADGQARGFPVTFLWLRHLTKASDWSSVGAAVSLGICAVGIENALPFGSPVLPAGFDARLWASQKLGPSLDALHTWGMPAMGVAPTSTQTGAQEDQLFVGGEPLLCTNAVLPVYLSGMKFANRPCHHLEHDGTLLTVEKHPLLVFWTSRAHWHPQISKDRLNKPEPGLAPWDVPGSWWGPDREHWLMCRLVTGYRYTGSRLLRRLLQHQHVSFMFGETVSPGMVTSHTDAARSVGYAGLVAIYLDNTLPSDQAALNTQRWRDRVQSVYTPEISSSPGNVWDPRPDNRILQDFEPGRYAQGVMWWQQSLGSYGLDLACELLGPPEGRQLAHRAALAVLEHSWRFRDGHWICWENTGYTDGTPLSEVELQEGVGGHRTGWFEPTWMVPGIAVLLRHNPEHETARAIWAQVASDGGSWVPPGVQTSPGIE